MRTQPMPAPGCGPPRTPQADPVVPWVPGWWDGPGVAADTRVSWAAGALRAPKPHSPISTPITSSASRPRGHPGLLEPRCLTPRRSLALP